MDFVNELENKYIKNIPQSNINISEFFCHIEQEYYDYEDILRSQNPRLNHFKNFREFSKALFTQSTILATLRVNFCGEFIAYTTYRKSIPLCGGILLNNSTDKVLLVQDFNSSSWTFPRGKKTPGESDIACAIREVMEETSFDITSYVDETDFITINLTKRVLKLYIIWNVPESYNFQPKTRKEISGLKFYSLNEIPSESFHVRQFLQPLRERLPHNNNDSINGDDDDNDTTVSMIATNSILL